MRSRLGLVKEVWLSGSAVVRDIVRLMIHRYHQLGILDEQGLPMQEMEVMFTDSGNGTAEEYTDNAVLLQRAAGVNEATPGRRPSERWNYAMIKRNRCDFCTACGAQEGRG